jgi:hypothetical protein
MVAFDREDAAAEGGMQMQLLVALAALVAGFWLVSAIAVTVLIIRAIRQPSMRAAAAPSTGGPVASRDGPPQHEQES